MEIGGVLNISPQPAERARRTMHGGMMTSEKYRRYQSELRLLIRTLNLVPGHYIHLEVVFFVTGEEQGVLVEKKPDTDNYVKALKDCLADEKILVKKLKQKRKNKKTGDWIEFTHDDQMIASTHAAKIGCGDNPGVIVFTLMDQESYFLKYGNPRDIFF